MRHWKPKPSKDEPPGLPGYDDEFNQLRTAKAWRLTPALWRQQSIDDRALMMAFEMFEGMREAFRAEYRDDKRQQEEDRRKKNGTGQSDYERLKRMMEQ